MKKKPPLSWQDQLRRSHRGKDDAPLVPFIIAVATHVRGRLPDLGDGDMQLVSLDVYRALCTAVIVDSFCGWSTIPTARGRRLVLAAFLAEAGVKGYGSEITEILTETMENAALMEGVQFNRSALPEAEQWQVDLLLQAADLLKEMGARSRPTPLWLSQPRSRGAGRGIGAETAGGKEQAPAPPAARRRTPALDEEPASAIRPPWRDNLDRKMREHPGHRLNPFLRAVVEQVMAREPETDLDELLAKVVCVVNATTIIFQDLRWFQIPDGHRADALREHLRVAASRRATLQFLVGHTTWIEAMRRNAQALPSDLRMQLPITWMALAIIQDEEDRGVAPEPWDDRQVEDQLRAIGIDPQQFLRDIQSGEIKNVLAYLQERIHRRN